MEKPKTTLSAQDRVILFCVAIEIGDSHLKDGRRKQKALRHALTAVRRHRATSRADAAVIA